MSLASAHDLAEEARRARKLEAAKKKLKTFRATRSSVASSSSSHSRSPSASSSKSASLPSRESQLATARLPLMSDSGANASPSHSRSSSKGKGRALRADADAIATEQAALGSWGMGHERMRSGAKASGRHRRQQSSISVSARPALAFSFPGPPVDDDGRVRGLRGEPSRPSGMKLDLPVPRDIITTPATPLLDAYELDLDPFAGPSFPPVQDGEEDVKQVKQRLSAFSFGSKSPSPHLVPASPSRSPTSPGRRQRGSISLLPSLALRSHDLNFMTSLSDSASASVSAPAGLDRLGQATPSRPPSLLLTKATPLMPSPSAPHRPSLPGSVTDSPSPCTPPTPARKRHSHTRSNSISLSALKLGTAARPISLGIPSSPSFPSSPSSPASPDALRPAITPPLNGTRLKFEPSEAEMAKEESRRKALEKLTGSSPVLPPPEVVEERQAEIALPDLEDDTSSTASSSRPLSSAWGSSSSFTFARPSSFNLSAPDSIPSGRTSTPAMGFGAFPTWPADDAAPMSFDKWSAAFKDEGLGFGAGFGLGAETMPKRGSFTGSLAVLKEEEETEEEAEAEAEMEAAEAAPNAEDRSMAASATDVSFTAASPVSSEAALPPPPSSRLRELHLVSAGTSSTPVRPALSKDSPSTSSSAPRSGPRPAPISPSKGYGLIGRGRPRPLSGIGGILSPNTSGSTSPLTGSIITPKTARPAGRRRLSGSAPGSGRRSSISYKRDQDASASASAPMGSTDNISFSGSSFSSRWSTNSRVLAASPPMTDHALSSPPLPLSSAGTGTGWAHVPRAGNRPCPRPKSLVGLGIVHAGSNRVLSEVAEKDEGGNGDTPIAISRGITPDAEGDGWQSAQATDRPFTFRSFGSVSHSLDLTSEPGRPDRRSLESEGGARWRDSLLELELERDALREDVEGWRERYRALEDKLEVEKKESGVLRERVRKLSDRLLTVSSLPPQSPGRTAAIGSESRLVREMRDQLFSLTSAVEKERRENEAAQLRIAELERQLSAPTRPAPHADIEDQRPWSFSPYSSAYPSETAPQWGAYAPSPSTPIVTPATPLHYSPAMPANSAATDSSPIETNDNEYRMRAWGFPARPTQPSAACSPAPAPQLQTMSSKGYNKRDSFFGLSKVPRQAEFADEVALYDGVDLPPFIVPNAAAAPMGLFAPGSVAPNMMRAVSDPAMPSWAFSDSETDNQGQDLGPIPIPSVVHMTESASASSFSNSAFSLISGYLPGRISPTKKVKAAPPTTPDSHATDLPPLPHSLSVPPYQAHPGASEPVAGVLDMTVACRCCIGEVIEL